MEANTKNGLPSRLHDQPAGAVHVIFPSIGGGSNWADTLLAVLGPLLVMVIVYVTTNVVMGVPVMLTVCVIAKSAEAFTVAFVALILFAVLLSCSLLLTVAVFVAVTELGTVPDVGGVVGIVGAMRMRTVAFALDKIVPKLQLIGPVPVQVPCEGVTETNVNCPPGITILFISATPVASSGPLLVTVTLYARLFPTSTGFGVAVCVTIKSATAFRTN